MNANKCSICGSAIIEMLSQTCVEVDPLSAMGRRIFKDLCWVCQRLKVTAEREAAQVVDVE